jgi:glycosyltransferase involved in cell wall biosynthesis
MRIELVFGPTGCTSGGLSIDVSTIANGLAARGHVVTVVTTASPQGASGNSYVAFSDDVRVERLAVPSAGSAATRVSLTPGVLSRRQRRCPDVVHVFSLAPNFLHTAAAMKARLNHIPLVLSPMMHPGRVASWRGRGLLGVGMRGYDAVAPRIAARADLVVVATSEEESYFRSLSASAVVCAPPGVEPCEPITTEEIVGFRRRLNLSPARPVVLAVTARDEPRKGLGLLREVARDLEVRCPQASILVAGMERPATADGAIVCTGRLNKRDLACAYAAADVTFVPSRYEAFSRVVIEAWQQGRPVVVTRGVGLASEVASGAGLVVPTDDREEASRALIALLLEKDRATSLGARGREMVRQHYEWPAVIDRLERAYYDLCRQTFARRGTR